MIQKVWNIQFRTKRKGKRKRAMDPNFTLNNLSNNPYVRDIVISIQTFKKSWQGRMHAVCRTDIQSQPADGFSRDHWSALQPALLL